MELGELIVDMQDPKMEIEPIAPMLLLNDQGIRMDI